MLKLSQIRGPWFSLGFHVDLQRHFIDLHFFWWILTIGNNYEQEAGVYVMSPEEEVAFFDEELLNILDSE